MILSELLAELNAKDIELKLSLKDELLLRAKKGVLDESLKIELVQHKQEIIALLKHNAVQSTKEKSIFSFGKNKYPLSSGQSRMYFHEMLSPKTATYNVPFVARFKKMIDVERLQNALNTVIVNHPSLRTRFILDNNVPQQVIEKYAHLPMSIVDCRCQPTDKEVLKLINEEVRKPFDLTLAPLIRLTLVRLKQKSCFIIMVMHHIITDAWSLGIILNDLNTFYAGSESDSFRELVNMGDFALYESARLKSQPWKKLLAQRVSKLKDFPKSLNALDQRRSDTWLNGPGKTYHFTIDLDITKKLKMNAERCKVSVASTLFALYGVLVKNFIQQERVIIGLAVAQRDFDELQSSVGFLVNSVPVPVCFNLDSSSADYISSCHNELVEALAYKDIPLELLVEGLDIKRELGVSPLIQAMFTYHDIHLNKSQWLGYDYETVPVDIQQSKFSITAGFYNAGDKIEAAFEFNDDFFTKEKMLLIVEKYRALVAGFSKGAYTRFDALAMDALLENGDAQPVELQVDETCAELMESNVGKENDSMKIAIAGIWSELLGLKNVTDNENFFEIGGNSLLAIQFVSKMREREMPLTLRHVYKYQTIAGICENHIL